MVSRFSSKEFSGIKPGDLSKGKRSPGSFMITEKQEVYSALPAEEAKGKTAARRDQAKAASSGPRSPT